MEFVFKKWHVQLTLSNINYLITNKKRRKFFKKESATQNTWDHGIFFWLVSKAYWGDIQKSMIGFLYEHGWRLRTADYFWRKAPP